MTIENATERVVVLASRELLEEMQRQGWGPAVRVRARQSPDGTWEMSFRAAYDRYGKVVDIEPDGKEGTND